MPWELTPLGDSALLVRIGDSLGTVLALTRRLEEARIRGVVDIAPAFASIGIFFASPEDLTNATNSLHAILRGRAPARSEEPPARLIEVPVCYEPDYGPDLMVVSASSRLSPKEIASRHATASYRVRCVGFTPGFPYLGGLPTILATPRRASPRVAVPAGSVAIGGAQTGIYPLASPGGWNIIGRTPLRLFDVTRQPATLFAAGDRVRFVAITAEQFRQWKT